MKIKSIALSLATIALGASCLFGVSNAPVALLAEESESVSEISSEVVSEVSSEVISEAVSESASETLSPIQIIKQAAVDWSSPIGVITVFAIISIILLAFLTLGLFIHLIRTSKAKRATNQEFSDSAKIIISKEISEFLKNEIKGIVEEQTALTKETADEIEAIMRVTLLAQENTPEARLEIIKELQKHKRVDGELADKIQRIVNDSIAKRDAEIKESEESIENAKKAVQDLSPIVDETKKEEEFGSL